MNFQILKNHTFEKKIMKSNLFLLIVFLFSISSITYCQEITKESDFLVHHYSSAMELEFYKNNYPTSITVINVLTQKQQQLTQTSFTTYIIDGIHPADIFKVEYTLNSNTSLMPSCTYIAAKSASTGAISVYFNHPVDVMYAQTQQAVNLSNTVKDKLISYINNCVASLDIAIYDSYSPSASTGIAGAINAAYARGVQVRVIYDGSTSSTMISLLNNSIPRLASPTTSAYGIMHNKFVVFDANNSNPAIPMVWTGSTNWTSAQIDGPDKNSVVIIQDQSLALAYKIEFEEMWGSNTMIPNTTNSKFGSFKTDNTPHNFVVGGKIIQSYFSPSDGTTAKIVNAINSANSDIEVAVMDITRTDCSGAINSKYNGGITNTNVLVDSQNPSGNQITTFQTTLSTRAKVYSGSGIMHHKFMVIDNYDVSSDPLVLVGSHNWSTSAETKNDENTLIIHDANIANQYYQAFAYLFELAGGFITPPLSITNENYQDSKVKIYPNPTHGILHIMSPQIIDYLKVTIYDVLGNKMKTADFNEFTQDTIDISNQASGIYYIKAESEGTTTCFKIVKD
jgi:phosphatidylserine/phosphatidylglycerophosphate/cardiolipin synthase-like enzyme